jgi:hypothetical protein
MMSLHIFILIKYLDLICKFHFVLQFVKQFLISVYLIDSKLNLCSYSVRNKHLTL